MDILQVDSGSIFLLPKLYKIFWFCAVWKKANTHKAKPRMDCQNERTNKTIIRVLGRHFNPLLEHAPRQEWRGGGVVEWG